MGVVIVCAVLLSLGIVAGAGWSGRPFAAPDPEVDLTAGEVARRYAWYSSVALVAGIAAGVTVIGAGGRLAMRLLAVTAGDGAQGRITEAEQVVGDITVGGTIAFVVFNGVFGGVVLGALYLVVRRFLPAGPLGGVAYGLFLLVVMGAVVEPLRPGNPDFDLVGPGWLAVLVFTLMAIAFGLAVEGFTARTSAWLPQPSPEPRVLARYAAPALLALMGFTVTVFAVVVGAVTVVVTRLRVVVDVVRSRGWVVAGRVALVVLAAVSLPNALSAVADIATR